MGVISSGFRNRGALGALYTAGPQHSIQVRCGGPAYVRPHADQYSRTVRETLGAPSAPMGKSSLGVIAKNNRLSVMPVYLISRG